MDAKHAQIGARISAVRSIYKDGRIDARRGCSYPEPDFDEFVTVYDDQVVIRVTSRGKVGDAEVEVVRDFVDHALADMESLLAENARLRLKLTRAAKRVGGMVVAARRSSTNPATR